MLASLRLASLRAYLIIDPYQRMVTVWSRDQDEWTASIAAAGVMTYADGQTLDIGELYRDILP